MAHLGRSSWTTTSNGAVAIKQAQKHVTLHYPGFGTDSVKTAGWSRERCYQQLRAWRKMHVGSGAYKEVAYNFYALPNGDFVDGRGLRQNGANGTSAANRAGLSIQVLVGDNEDLTAGHVKAVNDCLAYIAKHYPQAVKTLYGHQRWVSTRCPGPKVMAALKAGRFGAGKAPSAPSPGASAPTPSKPAVVGGKLTVDGRWGRETSKALQRFLKGKGHAVGKIDGRMGPKSWRALQEYLRAPYKDGKISRQSYRHTELGNGISPNGWEYTGRKSRGSQAIELLQKWAGASVDGVLYEGTTKAVQRKLNAGG